MMDRKSALLQHSLAGQALAIAALAMGAMAQAQPMYTGGNRPVMLQADGDGLDPCVYAVIYDEAASSPDGGGGVMVFPGDSTDLDYVDVLLHGDNVWMCEVSDDFAGVVYPEYPGQDCEVSVPQAADRPYLGPCKWGWVKSQWVEVIAG